MISDGLIEMNGKRCHESCKDEWDIKWRKAKNLDRF